MTCTICGEPIRSVVRWLDNNTAVCEICYESLSIDEDTPPDERGYDEEDLY